MESLGGLSGHRDKKMFQSIQFVLGLVCVFACFTVFVFSIVLYLQRTLLEGWVDYLGGQVKNVSKL